MRPATRSSSTIPARRSRSLIARPEIREGEIFVAVLGASSFTYAEATWTQTLPDWIGSHVRIFRFFDGVPRLIVPDNLKSGVNHASFYDPEINRSYGMMASDYGVGQQARDPGVSHGWEFSRFRPDTLSWGHTEKNAAE